MEILYYAGYYLALFLIPFVVYFLIFKKNEGRSIYTSRDWFYFIKSYYARNAVRKYQQKYREECTRVSRYWQVDKQPETYKHSTAQLIYGVDQTGNSVSIRFTLRYGAIAEVSLCLRLSDGNVYAFPECGRIKRVGLPKVQWKINGLNIEILEPFKRFRLTFNGLLQNVSVKDFEKVEHVQFSFIFNSVGSPTYIPQGMDTGLIAEALVRETWRDGSWVEYLVDQCGYEQFGALQGFIKRDSYPDLHVLNLATSHSKYRGLDDRFLLRRELRLFLADYYGNVISIVVKSFKNGCSQLNYGSVVLSNNKILPLKAVDISLSNVGENCVIPEMLTVHVEVKKKSFKCIVHLNNSQKVLADNSEDIGYNCYNIPAECDINEDQGRAIVEFWYSKKGNAEFVPDTLISPKTVSILPGDLTLSIGCDDSKIVELTGGKGSSLALLSSINSAEIFHVLKVYAYCAFDLLHVHIPMLNLYHMNPMSYRCCGKGEVGSKEFTVPMGFIITVNAFKRQLEWSSRLAEAVQALDNVCCGRESGEVEFVCYNTVECFKKEKIKKEIVDAVLKELLKIGKDGDGWAVRSSAIGEDSEDLSAAGQNETFLGCVTYEQILRAISACWASLFTYQSVQYRWQHGLPVIADMAVVVQRMVPADSAGVLFTWHPSTSNPSQMVITSNYGLGESVVSGQTDPDTFILNRTWNGKVSLLSHDIGMKNKVIKMTARGVEEINVEKQDTVSNENWSITPEQALYLGKVGVLLENTFGGPRDVEWAFYKGQLHLLQSRPITTLNVWSEFELTHELDGPMLSEQSVLTLANISEVIPNAMTVLSQTTTIPILDRGLQLRLTNRYDPYSSNKVLSCQHTGMIDDLSIIHINVSTDIKTSSTILDLAIFGHKVLDEKINNIAIKRLAWRNQAVYIGMREAVANMRFDIEPDEPLLVTYRKIENTLDKLYYIGRDHSCVTSVSVFYQVLTMNILLERAKELTPEHCADFAKILSSCADVVSAEIPAYLENIAKIIRDEGYTEEFCTIKPEFGATWLEAKCPESHKIFKEFLEKHGHRNLGEFELMEQTWSENASKVITMIQANARHEPSGGKAHTTVDEVVNSLVTPKSGITRRIIKFIINKIQSAVSYRELSKSELIRGLYLLKTLYRQLAKRMVSRGILPSPDLIYHLTHYEIGQVIQGSSPLLITKAIRRQRLYPKWLKFKFPEIMFGRPVPETELVAPTNLADKVCKGTTVCTGTVKARACVINSLDDVDQLEKGDVLITHSTDIGWSPYFPMLSGIVTEMGGLISHGAVVAREYGLPCIVGVKNATKVFKTGDMVVLYASTGELGLAK